MSPSRGREGAPPVPVRGEDRKALRLLEMLSVPGSHAERRADQVVLVRKSNRLTLSAGVPGTVLDGLLEAGALACLTRNGGSEFHITEAGRARLRRGAGSESAFADQHRVIEQQPDGEGGTRRVNLREDPLAFLRRSRAASLLIGEAELVAGERLRVDLTQAQTLPQVTANWSRLVVDGAGYVGDLTPSERVLAARERVDRAMRAVGPDFAGLLMDVCGFGKGLEAIERDYALPLRAGKVALGYALRALARHYGLSNAAVGKDKVPMRHWGSADYRPRMASSG